MATDNVEISLRDLIEEKFKGLKKDIKGLCSDVKGLRLDVKRIDETINGNGKSGLKIQITKNTQRVILMLWVGGVIASAALSFFVREVLVSIP